MLRRRCGGRAELGGWRMQPAALRAAADPLGGGRFALWVAALALAVSLGADAPAHAQSEEIWGSELANELMSPWCPGFALPDCTSGYAKQLHAWILEQEKLGRPRAEVEAEVLARYGEKIRQAPKAEGRAWFAYAIPALALAAGLGIVVRFLRRQGVAKGASAAPSVTASPLTDQDLAARVAAELAAYENTNPSA